MTRAELADLRLAFRVAGTIAPRTGLALPCWLRQFDERKRPCEGRIEAFHFIGRQRVRNRLLSLGFDSADPAILLASWDPRNAGPGCVMHHRRLDGHATPDLTVFREQLPVDVLNFAEDWGLETDLEDRYPLIGGGV